MRTVAFQTSYPCCKRELQIIGPECVVLDGGIDTFIQKLRLAKEILCGSKPEAE